MAEETRTVLILDREIEVKEFRDSQIMLMVSEAKTVIRKTMDMDRRMDGVDRLMRLFDSVVVKPEDKEWLVEQNIAGALSMGDLTGFISAFSDNAQEITPRPVRRGRPRKQ
jgi:hypothetical protein